MRLFTAETVQQRSTAAVSSRRSRKGVLPLLPVTSPLVSSLESILEFPARVVFEKQVDPDALYLGRPKCYRSRKPAALSWEKHCSRAETRLHFAPAPERRIITAVSRRTVLLLLRIRLFDSRQRRQLLNAGKEVIMAAFENDGGAINWLAGHSRKERSCYSMFL